MKTLFLSNDDIQNFGKTLFDSKLDVQLYVDADARPPTTAAANNNLLALQYYIKQHPPAATVVQQQTQQQQQQQQTSLNQSQLQLKQLQLKQPTVYHRQHSNTHTSYNIQHHPYYQQTTPVKQQTNLVAAKSSLPPVHVLNQNSNISAASSGTGGSGSSIAATQQSSSSASSSQTSNNSVKSTAKSSSSNSSSSRSSMTTSGKKLKTEPLLSQMQRNERIAFANNHLVWTEENWKRVVFCDERKFNLDGPDGFSYYFHDLRNYERTLSQRPRGNSVFIYFIICSGGPIHLEASATKFKPEACIETIMRERANIVKKLGGETDFVLQDHNWSINASPTMPDRLSAEGIKTQKWPTIAHDLNIMENIWGWLIREVFDGGRKFSRKDDLIFRVREAWTRLPMDLINNLYTTLPERMLELHNMRGVYTNC